MTFADDMQTAAEDLMDLVDDGGWQHLPHVGDPVDIDAYLDESPDMRLDAYGRPLTIDGLVLHCKRSDFDADPGNGDTFTNGDTSYSFQSILRKDGYFYELIVREVPV